jgi:hypothetical protein
VAVQVISFLLDDNLEVVLGACSPMNVLEPIMSVLFKNIKIKIYRSIILPIALHLFETLSLTLKQRFPKCAPPPRGRCWSSGGGVSCLCEGHLF